MPRVLLAWEFGRGRGHVLMLRRFAAALGAPSLVDAALCSLAHANALSGLCDTIVLGPALVYDNRERLARGDPMTATWGEYLGDLGFRDAAELAPRIAWWRDFIESRRIGLVIADYAPLAVLAARGLGIRVVGTGMGYGLGPASMPEFPVLIERYGERVHDEQAMVSAVNAAAGPYGVPKLTRLPEINAMDDMLVQSLPFFDPYRTLRDKPHLPPLAEAPAELAEAGDEIFLYASGQEFTDSQLLDAATTLGVPLRVYAPGADAPTIERLRAANGVTVEPAPRTVDEIARRSWLFVNSGQPSSMTMGLACGLPQVAIPQHLEQLFHAETLAREGPLAIIGPDDRSAAGIRDTILGAYHDAGMRRRARELAREVRPLVQAEARPMIRARLDAVMMRR